MIKAKLITREIVLRDYGLCPHSGKPYVYNSGEWSWYYAEVRAIEKMHIEPDDDVRRIYETVAKQSRLIRQTLIEIETGYHTVL